MYEMDYDRQGIGALIDSNLLIQVDSVLSGGSIHGGLRVPQPSDSWLQARYKRFPPKVR